MQEQITFNDLLKSIKSALRLVLKKWYIIALMCIIGGAAGGFYAYTIKPKYEADLTFIVEEESKNGASGLLGLASQFGVNIGEGNDAFSPRNIIAILKSKKIILATLLAVNEIDGRKDRLLNFYLKTSGIQRSFEKNDRLKNISYPISQNFADFSLLQDSILQIIADQFLKKNIEIEKTDDKTDIFKLTCTTTDEQFSLQFSNQIIKEVTDFYTLTKTKRSLQIVNLLQKRADSILAEYNTALSGRASTLDANINPALQLPLVNVQRKQTDITILATGYGELIKNLEVAKFNLLKETPLVQIIDGPLLPLKKIKPGRLLYALLGGFLLASITALYLIFKKHKPQSAV